MALPTGVVASTNPGGDYGRIVEVQPKDKTNNTVIERAPDSAGSPDTGNIETVAFLQPGIYVYRDVIGNDGATYYWRAKHTKNGYTDSGYTDWTDGYVPVYMPYEMYDPAMTVTLREGRRRNDTIYDSDGHIQDSVNIADTGGARRILRHSETSVVQDASGEVAVTFPSSYENAPEIVLIPHQVIMYNTSLGGSIDQYLRLQALNVSTTGFTARAKNVDTGTTTAQNDEFPSGNLLDAEAETTEANLDPAGANDDTYTVHYEVSVTATSDPGETKTTASLTLAIDSNDGSGWVERATYVYTAIDPAGGGGTTNTWSQEDKSIVVTGLGLNDDLRLRAKDFSVTGGGTGSFSAHGFNKATDADAEYGVTYTTATDTEESAMPNAEDGVRYIAIEAA